VKRHAVISGAGIAGPAVAHQLAARGWQTTVIERFPERRDEGQNIDVRGTAREVARRMGIEDDLRAANTGEIGMRFLREDGSPAATFPMSAPGEIDGPTAEFEILRGELSRILIEHSQEHTDYRFNTQIADLTDRGDQVTVTLDDGTPIEADLVVITEGLRSRSRRFVTPTEVNDFGMYIGYATLPRRESDGQWWNWQHAAGSRAVHLRPDNLGTTRAMLSFISDVRGLEDLRAADQLAVTRRTFADVGGIATRVLEDLTDDVPWYFSAVGQVDAAQWRKGRVLLLGDAAFCAATFGGTGTSLALIGAYLLAGELSRTDDLEAGLAGYEKVMRSVVDSIPPVKMSVLRRANPRTHGGIRALHAGARVIASPLGQKATGLLSRRFTTGLDALQLPDYPPADATRNSPAPAAVDGPVTELSPTDWVREQTERILAQGTTDGVEVLDRPIVLFTTTGVKSGKQRYVPLMRVESDGKYAMVASKGGDPKHPSWYFNVKANPSVTVQDGEKTFTGTAREISGAERDSWWKLAVEAYPPYAEYQTKTDRLIPVFVIEPGVAE
jgi:deazaflavin-dependent oxidoreductase (nitroreductase family)